MNLNAKRQGVTPFSFAKPADDKSTITELQGLLESRHFTPVSYTHLTLPTILRV